MGPEEVIPLRVDKKRILLYRRKEMIHSETELIIYKLKWYSPTSIVSLSL